MNAPGEKAVLLFLFVAILARRSLQILFLMIILHLSRSAPVPNLYHRKCLAEPLKPQYGGGILVNPEFNDVLKGWVSFGDVKAIHKVSKSGNKYAVAVTGSKPPQSISQKFQLETDKLYAISAWVQVDKGSADVRASVKTPSGFVAVGSVVANASCWSMLKGGLTVNVSGPGDLYFEANNSTAEIWIDNVSFQPFTQEEWKGHHNESADQKNKKPVTVTAADKDGKPIAGAKVTVNPIRAGFPFGTAINAAILKNTDYQKWFASRFTVTTFENEMKWYGTEFTKGHEDFSVADAMLEFAKKNNVHVRGHNVFWDDQNAQMDWVAKLPKPELEQTVAKHLKSVVTRYKGKVIHWDVVNENVHFNFFETKLSPDASTKIFQEVNKIDPDVLLFMNDFNTLENPGDWNAMPDKYLKKFHEIKKGNPKAKMAIGLESHFDAPNIANMRAVLDKMATAGVPIWLTEVDVGGTDAKQAHYLEQILREGYSHPAVQGIVMWASWTPKGCYRMCLTDNQFKNLPVGDIVDSLIKEWKTHAVGTTGEDGSVQAKLAHGEYSVNVTHPATNSSSAHKIKVGPDSHRAQVGDPPLSTSQELEIFVNFT